MVTPVKGDRESKQNFVRHVLDQAFTNRVSLMCTDFELEQPADQAEMSFVKNFKLATDAWNVATAAIAEEYPK